MIMNNKFIIKKTKEEEISFDRRFINLAVFLNKGSYVIDRIQKDIITNLITTKLPAEEQKKIKKVFISNVVPLLSVYGMELTEIFSDFQKGIDELCSEKYTGISNEERIEQFDIFTKKEYNNSKVHWTVVPENEYIQEIHLIGYEIKDEKLIIFGCSFDGLNLMEDLE